jgi:hypothetical protein
MRYASLVLGASVSFLFACANGDLCAEDGAAASKSPLAGASWPDGIVHVCWTASSAARSDFATVSVRTQHLVEANWGAAADLTFTGWSDTCAASADTYGSFPRATISINVTTGALGAYCAGDGPGVFDDGKCQFGYTPDVNTMNIGTWDDALQFRARVLHEFGHALGLAHQPDKDGPAGCVDPDSPDYRGPVRDENSIMLSTYADVTDQLSGWDALKMREAYGPPRPTYSADVDGDGRDDSIVVSDNAVYVRKASVDGLGVTQLATPLTWQVLGDDRPGSGDRGTALADVNADGRADFIRVQNDGLFVSLSTGTTFDSPKRWSDTLFYGTLGTFFADVTGDGCADAIAVGPRRVTVRVAEAAGFGPETTWRTGYFESAVAILFGDVTSAPARLDDGEVPCGAGVGAPINPVCKIGTADMVVAYRDWVTVYPSTGGALGNPLKFAADDSYGELGTRLTTIKGDPWESLLLSHEYGTMVRQSTGSSFDEPEVWSGPQP